MADRPKFWVVWSPRGGRPSVRHMSPETAHTEAKRLSDRLPGRHFYVLEMVWYAINGPETLTWQQQRAIGKAAKMAATGNQAAPSSLGSVPSAAHKD